MYKDTHKLFDAIKNALKIFADEYEGKEFIILYRNNLGQVEWKKVAFFKRHFLHLTGVIYKDPKRQTFQKDSTEKYFSITPNGKKEYLKQSEIKKLKVGNNNTYYLQGNASDFYNNCLDSLSKNGQSKFDLKRIEEKNNGTTFQKLQVFPQLKNLMKGSSLLGYFNQNGYKLVADYFLGNSKKTVAIGFKLEKNYDIPKSLLSENVERVTQQPSPVIAVFSKKIDSNDYVQIFQSKGIPLNWKTVPSDVKLLLNHK